MLAERDWERVLFVGWGDDAGVTHYRTKLPARELGNEWVTILMDGEPHSGDGSRTDHDTIIVQSCWEPWQLRAMQRMRGSGARVIANVDDWLPAVAKLAKTGAHQFAGHFVGKRERTFVQMLQLCDAAITSTPWLAEKLRTVMPGKPIMVARNGLDLPRYDKWRGKAERKQDGRLRIGWAGGTGHGDALAAVLPEVWKVMRANPHVDFVSIGDQTPLLLQPMVTVDGEDVRELDGRVLHIAWNDMQFYPVSIDSLDIVIAPTRDDDFYRGKSQLRFYEAAAMGKPVVASSHYTEIDTGRTGFVVQAGGSWSGVLQTLIDSADLRLMLGVNARDYVERQVDIKVRGQEWKRAVNQIDKLLGAIYHETSRA